MKKIVLIFYCLSILTTIDAQSFDEKKSDKIIFKFQIDSLSIVGEYEYDSLSKIIFHIKNDYANSLIYINEDGHYNCQLSYDDLVLNLKENMYYKNENELLNLKLIKPKEEYMLSFIVGEKKKGRIYYFPENKKDKIDFRNVNKILIGFEYLKCNSLISNNLFSNNLLLRKTFVKGKTCFSASYFNSPSSAGCAVN